MSKKPTYDELEHKNKALEASLREAQRLIETARQKEKVLSAILAEVPLFIMVVNQYRKVQSISHAILKFTHKNIDSVLGLRGGDALRCLHHLDSSKGCGFGKACSSCVVRSTVQDSIDTGHYHYRVPARLSFIGDALKERSLLITTAPLNTPDKQVIVFVEDVTERDQAWEALRIAQQEASSPPARPMKNPSQA